METLLTEAATDALRHAKPIHVISLGAGVQSSTMALMAASDEIRPMPAFAVFADTQDEPPEVYEWLSHIRSILPFRVITATRSKLSEHLFEWGFSQIPCFTRNSDNKPSKGKRQCTKHWKIMPMYRAMRVESGTVRKRLPDGFFKCWVGISRDEATRMKPARVPWVENVWPLIDLRMTREDCKLWLQQHGYPVPPKSACFYCPLKDNRAWTSMVNGPLWNKALEIDARLNLRGEFLHSSCRPLSEMPFLRQSNQINLFENECEGMCGV